MSEKKDKVSLRQQIEDQAARVQSNELKLSRLREKLLKEDAKKFVIISEILEEWKEGDQQFNVEFHRRLDIGVKSDAERKLFDLPPQPKAEQEEQEEQEHKTLNEQMTEMNPY